MPNGFIEALLLTIGGGFGLLARDLAGALYQLLSGRAASRRADAKAFAEERLRYEKELLQTIADLRALNASLVEDLRSPFPPAEYNVSKDRTTPPAPPLRREQDNAADSAAESEEE